VSNGDAPTAQDVLVAAGWVEQLLRPLVTAEWSVPAGELEWSVRQVVDYLVDVCGFYAIHLAAQSDRRLRVDVTPHPQAGNDERLDVLAATGRLLAVTISAADPTATGWHFMGLTNASGFAGLACNELLVHGWDAARGLGIEFSGDDRVSARVLHRIYPEVEYGNTPWAALLAANGRH
jgi:hypothetical protein